MKIIVLISIIIIITSCGKSGDNPKGDTGATMSYQVNGRLVQIKGDLSFSATSGQGVLGEKRLMSQGFQNTWYEIIGQTGTNDIVNLGIPADSLQLKTYHIDFAEYLAKVTGGTVVFYKDTACSIRHNGDYTDITISSYSNGRISGNFTGILSIHNLLTDVYTNVTISEGSFQNVRINY